MTHQFDAREINDALEAASNLGAVIQREVRLGRTSPMMVLLAYARREACAALGSLANADADKPHEIRRLQNDVTRFIDMRDFIQETLANANEAAALLSKEELDEIELTLRPQNGNNDA